MRGFITVDRQTDYLLPPSVEDWLPQDHLARFIVEVIERLDLSELSSTALSWGHLQQIEKQLRREVQQLIALAESEGRKNVRDGLEAPRGISVSQSLPGGVVFQVDQAPSSDQTASWDIGERG